MDMLAMSLPTELLVLNKKIEDTTLGSIGLYLVWVFILSRAAARIVLHLHDEYFGNKSSPAFHDKSFWDAEYNSKKSPFEWYVSMDDLLPIISQYIPPQARILYPGCGTSQLPQSLLRSNPDCSITCCDNSDVAIRRARQLAGGSRGLSYHVMDVSLTSHYFGAESFGVVVDKGLVDSLLHDAEHGVRNVADCFDQYFTVLDDEGVFLLITTLDERTIDPFIQNSRFILDSRLELDGNKPEWEGLRRNALYVLHVNNSS